MTDSLHLAPEQQAQPAGDIAPADTAAKDNTGNFATTGEPAPRSRSTEAEAPSKVTITVEIEVGIMDWFRRHSDDPKAAIEAALRGEMKRERGEC